MPTFARPFVQRNILQLPYLHFQSWGHLTALAADDDVSFEKSPYFNRGRIMVFKGLGADLKPPDLFLQGFFLS
jgi:hypothetical protein